MTWKATGLPPAGIMLSNPNTLVQVCGKAAMLLPGPKGGE